MSLAKLPKIKTKEKKKRVGRGYGSGKGGHTVGLGTKGQKARQGKKPWKGFEGGQTPLYKKLPTIRGFKRSFAVKIVTLRIEKLNKFKDGDELTPERLLKEGILKKSKKQAVKVVAGGELKKKLSLKGFKFSENARKQIEKAGAKILEQEDTSKSKPAKK